MLIGYFQILCNFTIKTIIYFIQFRFQLQWVVLINYQQLNLFLLFQLMKNMSKIKIDFFIAPKETQQNRSAIFTIKDINSNKIYVNIFKKQRKCL